MSAWNDWHHCMANTYGTWLPGDPRGFRTRDHRRHVEGDYKSPPPTGKHDNLRRASKAKMSRPPVHLSSEARAAARDAILHTLITVHGIELLAIAVSRMHLHLLARFPKPTATRRGSPPHAHSHANLRHTDPARYHLGIAKERSAKHLARLRLVAPGGIWARRGKIVPITDRAHQLNVYHYILRHADEGAAVWSFRDPIPNLPPLPPKPTA